MYNLYVRITIHRFIWHSMCLARIGDCNLRDCQKLIFRFHWGDSIMSLPFWPIAPKPLKWTKMAQNSIRNWRCPKRRKVNPSPSIWAIVYFRAMMSGVRCGYGGFRWFERFGWCGWYGGEGGGTVATAVWVKFEWHLHSLFPRGTIKNSALIQQSSMLCQEKIKYFTRYSCAEGVVTLAH